jgi:hypothetical protein
MCFDFLIGCGLSLICFYGYSSYTLSISSHYVIFIFWLLVSLHFEVNSNRIWVFFYHSLQVSIRVLQLWCSEVWYDCNFRCSFGSVLRCAKAVVLQPNKVYVVMVIFEFLISDFYIEIIFVCFLRLSHISLILMCVLD